MEKKFSLPKYGYEVVLGKYATQAAGAAWLSQGGTVVLSTVTTAVSKEFPGFLPLTVDYREYFSAAGKIPGGYFKREGKFSDKEVLTGRLIDRAIRPLFPVNFFDQLQLLSTVYSVDQKHMPHALALLASSIALTVSKVPFLGPVGVCEAVRINGEWILNPTFEQSEASDSRILVAGTQEGVNMVEGTAAEMSEAEFVDIMFKAHEVIKEQVAWQKSIAAELNVIKDPIVDTLDWATWTNNALSILTEAQVQRLFTADKVERALVRDELETAFLTKFAEAATETKVSNTFLAYIFDQTLKNGINELIFSLGKRIDQRGFDVVRSISSEVGLLPFAHGSSLFTRGRTQALASVTLGGGQDELKSDSLMGETVESSFMLHYNFPAFAVGEVRPNRGPGRREVGHGYLAASAIKQVLPTQEEFPYTTRIVVDILESDGSSSMATVCSSTLALMDAGVPIRKMVGGVAMGLLGNAQGTFQVVTDISGIEDEFGLMDFKVAGTTDGITAIQMDIKYKGGLHRDLFVKALAQARDGRLHILQEMRKTMTEPRAKLSALVPVITSFKVAQDKIGAIIGKGGSVIKDLIAKTGTTIDIADDGTVKIFGHPGPKLAQAINWVQALGGNIERGTRYAGVIKRIADFGLFVEIAPGLDGLVHISLIPKNEQEKIMKTAKVNDMVEVEVVDYERETGRIRLKLIR